MTFQYLRRTDWKNEARLSTRAWSDRTKGNDFKLTESRVRLDIKKNFITVRVVRPWHRLLREAVAAPGSVPGQAGHWGLEQPGIVKGLELDGL